MFSIVLLSSQVCFCSLIIIGKMPVEWSTKFAGIRASTYEVASMVLSLFFHTDSLLGKILAAPL